MTYQEELIKILKEKKLDSNQFNRLKIKLSKQYGLKKIPRNFEFTSAISKENFDEFKDTVGTKPIRTISGVAPIAIMSKPIRCKHGACIMCPDFIKEGVAMSYTGKEPASMRGIRNFYSAYLQVMNRLEQYYALKKEIEKVELIIMGGTFPSFDVDYQNEFIMEALQAMNDFSEMFYETNFNYEKFFSFFELPGEFKDAERVKRVQNRLLENKKITTLEKEQLRNEISKIRNVTLVVETKPDWCFEKEINTMLSQGVTRVELGVQSLKDDVLKFINRGHNLEDTKKSIKLLRDSGYKVGFHWMVGLPKTTREEDIAMFKELFSNSDYQPDALKIYPCMVFKNTALYSLWQKGEFEPITTEEAASRIVEMKRFIPKYCRVMRVQRDIPTYRREAGVDRTNLRQIIHEQMKKKNVICKCIRCKEPMNKEIDWTNVKLNRIDYEAANGKEIFLSFDDVKNDILLGFLRLRIPSKPFRREITLDTSLVRELHVYGNAAKIGEEESIQHKGLGIKLMEEAERISKSFNCKKVIVISGIGVKDYYRRKLGYVDDGVYLSKTF
ncbi:tRNA uridine(34) 5-carboxymethylaminomethyl modification radical SAM/GNAT enzyme Elp3 [Candidatus Woesearchaeota archaeon]|nr:tRNA uridine(34) 5-carboxymethylaminomethyl modification radical SAM/GNAT enzyme Elp3 [Candidatus Woesearchaeota archaeon]